VSAASNPALEAWPGRVRKECWLDEAEATAAMVKACLAGDAAAWEEIVRLYSRRIYNLCYRFTGSSDQAEDLTQEVFIKVYRSLSSYDLDRGAFPTWLTTLTRNLLVDYFRKSKLQRMSDSLDAVPDGEEGLAPAQQLADEGPAPDTQVLAQEKQRMVQQALQKLSPELREAVILRDLQDMDYRDIAAVLKVPEGTVKSRINRGRTELARLLSRTYKRAQS
jgi:RNA polymerase sigma-70 factor (ECF subfamily)